VTWDGAAAWLLVFIGLALTIDAWTVAHYFRRQIRIAGGSWILVAFLSVVQTITAVAAWFTLARALVLAFGPSVWFSIVSGLALVWLLLIPRLLRATFRAHEGR
jgi:hypothetical protein